VVQRRDGSLFVRHCETVRTDAGDDIETRLAHIWQRLQSVVREYHPQVMGYEDQQGAQVGGWRQGQYNGHNSLVNLTVGIAVGCALAYGLEVLRLTPAQAKIALLGKGSRSAKKNRIKDAVERLYQLRGEKAPRMSHHAADAVAIAMGAERLWSTQKLVAEAMRGRKA